jgi:phospholipid/cholesterol/gamma-HCH transport system substrate-binding protein
MDKKVNFAIVGAFVLLLGGALVVSVLWLSSEKSYRKAYDTYLVFMGESVSGLSPDAAVLYRGVQVGRVRRIALAPGNVEKVQLMLDIERGAPIKQDTVAELRTQGLTGIAHVELTAGSRDAPVLAAAPGEDYPVIRTGPSLMVRLDATLTTLIAGLTRSSDSINALLDEGNRAALKQTLASLQRVSGTLAASSGAIGSGMANAARAMENTARASAGLPGLLERLQRSADALDRMSAEGARAAASAAQAADGARADVHQLAGEAGPDARLLLAELRDLAASMRRVSEQVERNPAVLLRGRAGARPGPGE